MTKNKPGKKWLQENSGQLWCREHRNRRGHNEKVFQSHKSSRRYHKRVQKEYKRAAW